MANQALAVLESALRDKQLDRTLTTALPPLDRVDPAGCVATGMAALDACLRGGLPRGELSELAGASMPHGSRPPGRMTLALQIIAAATERGELAALVDTCDRLDVASAAAAGIDLDRLLWIRGAGLAAPAASPESWLVDRALKALSLVLQAGGFGLVAIDLADIPAAVLKHLPFTTWLRLQRIVEGSDTACVLIVPEPLARSAGGLTLMLEGKTMWDGSADRSRRLAGCDIAVRVLSPRRRVDGDVTLGAISVP